MQFSAMSLVRVGKDASRREKMGNSAPADTMILCSMETNTL